MFNNSEGLDCPNYASVRPHRIIRPQNTRIGRSISDNLNQRILSKGCVQDVLSPPEQASLQSQVS